MDQLGSDMLVDSEYEEKQDVAIISPDDTMDEADTEPPPRADDEAAMFRLLQELPDLEVEAEGAYTWEIKNWRSLQKKEHGPVFECGGHQWRILFFPQGNNVDFASFYLEQGFEDNKPPENWYACVQFMLVLWNPNDPTICLQHQAHHRFTADEGDWGFTRFAELRKIFHAPWESAGRPMVENDTANITAYVRVMKDPTGVLWHNFINYDSKKETGMVGLKNQGATCYLNSLLQSLFFTNAFRKAVYQIPTEQDVEKTNSAYALQRLFYQLQTSAAAVSTNELTASFGWDNRQIFEQQDVQELSRILMERMEEKMKGTEAEDALSQMFVGKMKTYISCIHVNYESSRIEDFWDIQLNVSGNKNLDDSFKDYIQVETMEGENKYFAEGYGLQDAKKGVIFESFPQVLHLQLKRFEYDINRDAMMKVNDRYEFPEIWDASPYLSEGADRSEPYVYRLHSVLVHSGDLNAGHYYAFLKPKKDGHFYKFDDDRVTRATIREALEENFGGDYTNLANGNLQQRNPYSRTYSTKRSMSAYMLVYVRESRLDKILCSEDELDPPEHLARKFAEERAAFEKRRKEREEAHLYMDVRVATEDHFRAHEGFDVIPWNVPDAPKDATPREYRILKATTMGDFMKTVAADIGVDGDSLRPWAMVNRQNGTIRPDQIIDFPDMSVEEAANKYGTKDKNFKLFVETTKEKDDAGKPVWKDSKIDLKGLSNNKPLLLFLKHFDPDAQSLLGVCTFYAASQERVQDISSQIISIMGWEEGTAFLMFEEIKKNMIETMKPKVTLQASEIQDGDIVTVQKSLSEKEIALLQATGRYCEVREFYDYLLNRIRVKFELKPGCPVEEGVASNFELTLSKKMSYDQFATKVGEHLGIDPNYIRFSTVNLHTGKPKASVKRGINITLASTLNPHPYTGYGSLNHQVPDCLFYEVLEMSLSEIEVRRPMKVIWLTEGISKEDTFEILVPKQGIVSDLIQGLQKKLKLPDDQLARLRCFQAHQGKIIKMLPSEFTTLGLDQWYTIYAELEPEDEKELIAEGNQLIGCFNFDREPLKVHGNPFAFVIKKDEPFKETKERLSKRTGIKGKNFEKIKFALVSGSKNYSQPEYLNDDDIVFDKFQESREDATIGLDHVNKNRNNAARGDSIFIRG